VQHYLDLKTHERFSIFEVVRRGRSRVREQLEDEHQSPHAITVQAMENIKEYSRDSIHWCFAAAKILYLRELRASGSLVRFREFPALDARDQLTIEKFLVEDQQRQEFTYSVQPSKDPQQLVAPEREMDKEEEARRYAVLKYQLKNAQELRDATGLNQATGSTTHKMTNKNPSVAGDGGSRPASTSKIAEPFIPGPMYPESGWDDDNHSGWGKPAGPEELFRRKMWQKKRLDEFKKKSDEQDRERAKIRAKELKVEREIRQAKYKSRTWDPYYHSSESQNQGW